MRYTEVFGNLFNADETYHLAHCISSDCALGAGIAEEFERIFEIREDLIKHSTSERKHPTCLKKGRVLNLITKEYYWKKPTLDNFTESLRRMREVVIVEEINKIAMPMIGSGLDRLKWEDCKQAILTVFDDTDVEITVFKLK